MTKGGTQMSNDADTPAYTRRAVLRTAGILAGATAALAAFPVGAAAAPAARSPLRLAVLLPQSLSHPHFGANFLAGLHLGFTQANWSTDLQTAETGRGVGLVSPLVQELLGSVDFLVGMANAEVTTQFRDLLAEHDVPFIDAAIGANIPRLEDSSPHIFHYTLSHWQANWALGRWAASTLGKRGLIATSFYDSGFDTHYAFRLGFESAGGNVVLAHTTHIPPGGNDPATLVGPLASQQANFIYAGYCGPDAIDFIRAHAAAGLTSRLPLIGPAFLTDEQHLPALGATALGIRTASAWTSDLANTENLRFVRTYRNQTGQTPDCFALLGFETAKLIATAATTAPPAAGHNAAFRNALAAARFAGARGAVAMDGRTREVTGPLYLRKVKSANGGLINANTSALTPPPGGDRAIEALRTSLKTGWLAPYLCS
jgi:branched-chain amino acid transport system substrate-binding protein